MYVGKVAWEKVKRQRKVVLLFVVFSLVVVLVRGGLGLCWFLGKQTGNVQRATSTFCLFQVQAHKF